MSEKHAKCWKVLARNSKMLKSPGDGSRDVCAKSDWRDATTRWVRVSESTTVANATYVQQRRVLGFVQLIDVKDIEQALEDCLHARSCHLLVELGLFVCIFCWLIDDVGDALEM
jgi:hypothetical protein